MKNMLIASLILAGSSAMAYDNALKIGFQNKKYTFDLICPNNSVIKEITALLPMNAGSRIPVDEVDIDESGTILVTGLLGEHVTSLIVKIQPSIGCAIVQIPFHDLKR
ncbi:MAG: hypothetical protein K1X29_01520 [Bdellovibrionales bacterium]|nr:hypothetical protein [Bdellovibrionales bacterium]